MTGFLPSTLLAALLVTLLAVPADAAPIGPAVVHGSGRTRLEASSDWKDASAGDVLGNGVTVEASATEPLEMLLPDGVTVILEPGGQGRWAAPSKLSSESNRIVSGSHFVLLEGEVDVRMPSGPKGSHAFLVSTKAGTLTDWRGTAHIMAHEDTTAAAVYEGALVVGPNGRGSPMTDGAGILMQKGADPDRSRSIPGTPKWEPSVPGMRSLVAAPAGTRAQFALAWAPVPGAVSYRVVVAADAAISRVLERANTAETTFVVPESATAATPAAAAPSALAAPLWACVRAVGAEGIVGEWSAPIALRTVRYELPPGGRVAGDGAVVLPPQTFLAVSGADGVEVAYENVRSLASRVPGVPLYWMRVTGPLRLPDETPSRVVHLRDPASGAETQLVLARRELRADVDLSPRTPRPGDAIEARVVVWDPSGRIDPMSENLTLETLFDLEPVPVLWQRSGNVWRARISPRRTTTPWVLRVVVKDSLGLEVGRGFLEIAGGATHPD